MNELENMSIEDKELYDKLVYSFKKYYLEFGMNYYRLYLLIGVHLPSDKTVTLYHLAKWLVISNSIEAIPNIESLEPSLIGRENESESDANHISNKNIKHLLEFSDAFRLLEAINKGILDKPNESRRESIYSILSKLDRVSKFMLCVYFSDTFLMEAGTPLKGILRLESGRLTFSESGELMWSELDSMITYLKHINNYTKEIDRIESVTYSKRCADYLVHMIKELDAYEGVYILHPNTLSLSTLNYRTTYTKAILSVLPSSSLAITRNKYKGMKDDPFRV